MDEKKKAINAKSVAIAGALVYRLGIKTGYEIGTAKLYDVMTGWNREHAQEFYEYIKETKKITFK